MTAPYLAEKYEVSRRTINRDVEVLASAGIPIYTTQGVKGGISIFDGCKIDKTLLTSSDMQAILAGLRSLDSVSGTNRYAQLMEKLSAGSSSYITGDRSILIDLDSWKELELSDKIEKIQDAINSSRRTCFSYHSQALYPDFTIEEIYPNIICVKAIVSPKHKWKLIEEYGEKSFTEQADGNLLF